MAFLNLFTLLCLSATVNGIVVNKVISWEYVQAHCEEHQIAVIIHAEKALPTFLRRHYGTGLNSFCNFSQNCTMGIYSFYRRRIKAPYIVSYSCIKTDSVHAICNKTLRWQGPSEGILTSVETDTELYREPCYSIFQLNPGQVVVITALSMLEELQVNNKALHIKVPTVLTRNSTMTYRSVKRRDMILLYEVVVSNNKKSCKDPVDDESNEGKNRKPHKKGVKPLYFKNEKESTLKIQYLSVGGLSLGILAVIGLVVVLTVSILTLRRTGYGTLRLDQGLNPQGAAGLYETVSPMTEAPPASVYTALSKRKRPELGEVYSNV